MPKCLGCGLDFYGRAFGGHLSKTTNPACIEARGAAFGSDSDDDAEFGTELSGDFPTGGGTFAGDFFGTDYDAADLGYDSESNGSDVNSPPDFDSDDDSDELDRDPTAQDHAAAYEARAADGWEPPRASGAADEDTDMEDPAAPGSEPETPPRAREQRIIAEDRFHEKPVIEKFPGGRAGRSHVR
ncbi:hypothetical protein B0H14DRAFT_3537881 [Mycena olivaceomarginata]|nr:hypothetical protein B0H14DRAFT_3537881 [Mycena olivaceomarginata]